jgi:hypothetical protein
VAPMKILFKAWIAATVLGFTSAEAASPTIELKDGSRIQGEIQNIEDGVYTVFSPSIGILHIAQSNIVQIVYSSNVSNKSVAPGKSTAHDESMTRDIQQLQTQLAQDPAAMKSIMSLQSDPQIQAVLNDPAILKAIQEGDYASLLGNAKIKALENNERLRQLLQQQGH